MKHNFFNRCLKLAIYGCLIVVASSAHAAIELTTENATGAGTADIGGTFRVLQGHDYVPGTVGTGNFQPFLRLQDKGNQGGYNTSLGTPLDDKGGIWTHSLLLGAVPIVEIGGHFYREFLLDINQSDNEKKDNNLLSLNQIQIFLNSGDRADATTTFGTVPSVAFPGATLAFQMNSSTALTNEIVLNYDLESGSGNGLDMVLFVPLADLPNTHSANLKNVIFYSQFGNPPGTYDSDAGFEEWSVRKEFVNPDEEVETPLPAVPEPASLAIWSLGMAGFGLVSSRRRKALVVN